MTPNLSVTITADDLEALIDEHITALGFTNGTARAAQLALCAKSAPAEPDAERPISIPTALILWAGIEDQSQPTQWHKGYEAARGYVNMQICSAIPTTKDHLAVAEPVSREALKKRFDQLELEVMQNKHTAASLFTQMRTAALYLDPPSTDAELVALLHDARLQLYQAYISREDEEELQQMIKRIDAKLATTSPQ